MRWQAAVGVDLDAPAARALLTPYPLGEGGRRYHQDAAVRAVLKEIARGEKRALLTLATGAGKTFIAVKLLRRLFDSGLVRRALFVCDRDELRTQGLSALMNAFGSAAAEVRRDSDGRNAARNARIHVATFQTLGIRERVGCARSFCGSSLARLPRTAFGVPLRSDLAASWQCR